MMVISSCYGLFAIMGGSMQVLSKESVAIAVFLFFPILGFKFHLWFVVGALIVHGVFDFFHDHFVSNLGVPPWWPSFCLTCVIGVIGPRLR
jgi:hypothetical protein